MTKPVSDMVVRGADAILQSDIEGYSPESGINTDYQKAARAALLAALDPEDDVTVRHGAACLKKALDDMKGDYVSKDEVARLLIRHSIAALRSQITGGKDG